MHRLPRNPIPSFVSSHRHPIHPLQHPPRSLLRKTLPSTHQSRNLSTPQKQKPKQQWYTPIYQTFTRKNIKTALTALSLISGPILVWHPDRYLEKWGKKIEALGEPFRKVRAKGDDVGAWLRGKGWGVKDAAVRRYGALGEEREEELEKGWGKGRVRGDGFRSRAVWRGKGDGDGLAREGEGEGRRDS